MSMRARWQPRRANETAIARPIPPAAPVTMAVRPWRFNTIEAFSLFKNDGTMEGPGGERLQAVPGGSNIRLDAASPASLCGQQFDAQLEAFVDCNKMDYSRLET